MSHSPSVIYRLRVAGVLSALGNGMTGVAVTVYLATILPAQSVGIALAALSVGMLFSFAHGGYYADTHHRVLTMMTSDVVRTVATLTVLSATIAPTAFVAVLLTVGGCFINGLAVGYYRPALAAYWSSIVPPEKLPDTLAENSIINRLGLAAGAGLGGLFVGLSDPGLALLVDSATFILSALAVVGMRDDRDHAVSEGESTRAKLAKLIRVDRQWTGLFKIAARVNWMPRWLMVAIAMSIVTAIQNVALPIVLAQQYAPSSVGLFLTMPVWALLTGSIVSRVWKRAAHIGLIDWWGKVGPSVSGLLLAGGAPVGLSAGCHTTGSLAQATADPKIAALIGRTFPDDERGRIFAAQMGASSSLGALGMLGSSVLLTFTTPTTALAVASVFGIGITAVLLSSQAYLSLRLDSHTKAATSASS